MSAEKRPNDEEKPQEIEEGDDDGWIGPMPAEAATPKTKKRKGFYYVLSQNTLPSYFVVLCCISCIFQAIYLFSYMFSQTSEFGFTQGLSFSAGF